MLTLENLARCLIKRRLIIDTDREGEFCDTDCPFIDSEWDPKKCNLFQQPIVSLTGKQYVNTYQNPISGRNDEEYFCCCKRSVL